MELTVLNEVLGNMSMDINELRGTVKVSLAMLLRCTRKLMLSGVQVIS